MAETARKLPPAWKLYETEVHRWFCAKYPQHEILYDQRIRGRHSQVLRQVDVLVRQAVPEAILVGVFDCKLFTKRVGVEMVDSLVGFIDDVGAAYGGIVSARGFTASANRRAAACAPAIVTSVFESPETVVDDFVPNLNFSDPRNSMYLTII
jgi:hypothetical protein